MEDNGNNAMEAKDTQPGAQLEHAQAGKIVAKRKGSRKRNITIFIVVSLLNVGLLALLWSQLLTPAQNQAGANSDGPTVANPLKGRPAPDFRLTALNTAQAATLGLAAFKGKAIVLNFWSSSCGPCQHEAPLLQSTWQRMQAKGVVFVGVDFQDTQSDGVSFLQKYGITYPNVLDANGLTAINYGVVYTPTTYFINSKGVVVSMIPREMTAQDLQKNVQLLTG
ncbi:MAG TPA: TlpA disulfide reductase family protein [Ktedonobacteraceae bacterium]